MKDLVYWKVAPGIVVGADLLKKIHRYSKTIVGHDDYSSYVSVAGHDRTFCHATTGRGLKCVSVIDSYDSIANIRSTKENRIYRAELLYGYKSYSALRLFIARSWCRLVHGQYLKIIYCFNGTLFQSTKNRKT